MVSNPLLILKKLDACLESEIRLIIYGRAALALGFPDAPPDVHGTMDVDAILPLSHISEYEENEQFWLAVERLNEELDSQGLYLTHLFVDNQVILRKNWLEMIQPIDIKELQKVKLFRPATEDLLLSKMMRVDPLDRADMRFLADQAGLTQKRFEELILEAVVPPLPEIEVAFGQNKKWLLETVLIETQQS